MRSVVLLTPDFGDLKVGIKSGRDCCDLYLGDCLEKLRTMPDKSVDLAILDPPYIFQSLGGGGWSKDKNKTAGHYFGDIESLADGMDMAVLDEVLRVLKATNVYIWGNWEAVKGYMAYFNDKEVNTTLLCWHKANPPPLCGNGYLKDTEYCLFARGQGVKLYGGYKDHGTFWNTPLNMADKERYGHPTIKPLDIIRTMVRNSTREGDVVLDPYMGSGTTGLACVMEDRQFIGCEINPEYYAIAKRRCGI